MPASLPTPTIVSRIVSRQPGTPFPEAGTESNTNTNGEFSGDQMAHLGTIQNVAMDASADVWYNRTDNVIIVYNG